MRPIVLACLVHCPLLALDQAQLISDVQFQQGFQMLGTRPLQPLQGKSRGIQSEEGAPCWQLCEWWCKSSLAASPLEVLPDGSRRLEDATKSVTVGPAPGHLRLKLSSQRERNGVPRGPQEDWPHLLLQQQFSTCGSASPPLGELEALHFHAEVRVTDKRYEPEGYTPEHHAAQFLMYFTVADRMTGDFLWFGIQFYDDRARLPGLAVFPADLGSAGLGKYIYCPPASAFTEDSLHDGKWVIYDADVLPLMKEALASAWRDGRLLRSKNLDDYHVPYMNLGFELPGLHDLTGEIRGLSLTANSLPH